MTAAAMMKGAVFAIPGDLTTLSGGYIYERRLLEALRELGRDVEHIQLGGSYPEPTLADITYASLELGRVEAGRPLILDGFISGATPTEALARVTAPMVAVVHHPLAFESGLDHKRRDNLFRTEFDNLALMRHVIVPSPHTAAMLTEHYDVHPDRITIARPGTDAPLGPSTPTQPPVIVSVGIQHPRKGHDVLLKALAALAARSSTAGAWDWSAVIVGPPYDAEHAAELQRLHASLGLGDRVRFTGEVSPEELDQLYRSATLFTLATRYEGYGIVFNEALAYGLPIVSCAVGAVPDTVPADAGILVPADNPEALAASLADLLTDATRRGRLADASARAGAILPSWLDTAKLVGDVLDSLGAESQFRVTLMNEEP
ncbi:MAG: glycosyltransferase family 4 protein [Microbacteriaceae bacterium]